MQLVTYPQQWAFSKNPILADIRSDGRVDYSITDATGGSATLLMEGSAQGSFTLDIAEVAQTAFSDEPPCPVPVSITATQDTEGIITDIPDGSIRNVTLTLHDGDETETVSWHVLNGGVSKATWRRLKQNDTDIFSERFRNYNGNFFLTTRTEKWEIIIPETELAPLAFIRPENAITIRETLAGKTCIIPAPSTPSPMLAWLHLDALRKWFFSNHGVLPSIFEILDSDGTSVCRIAIAKARHAAHRHLVRFLNSYGQWELFDMAPLDDRAHMPSVSPFQSDSSTNDIFLKYDPEVNDFTRSRTRVKSTTTLKLHTGPLDEDKVFFLQDLLASEHIYVQHLLLGWVKALPSMEQTDIPLYFEEPFEAAISLQLAEDDSNITMPLSAYGSTPPRIHTEQFDTRFN